MPWIPSSKQEFLSSLDSVFNDIMPDDSPKHLNLKSYLIESNIAAPTPFSDDFTEWKSIGDNWYVCNNSKGQYVVIDCTDNRVWILYTIASVSVIDQYVSEWIRNNIGLDRCWFSKINFSALSQIFSFQERGLGLKFKNSITEDEDPFGFSMKAWFGTGANKTVDQLFKELESQFTTTSIRWRKVDSGDVTLRMECYNYGKITVNYMDSADDVFSCITEISNLYKKALTDGDQKRDQNSSAFEFRFQNDVNLDDYTAALAKGNSKLKLWMNEYERGPDYRRYTGVDLHNMDIILLDMASDHAYMSIPGKGCVNAAPRFATVQGENACGDVQVLYEGRDMFDFRQYR